MGRSPETDQEFWREVLLAGGSSELPAWCGDPSATVTETEVELSEALVTRLRALTGELAVSLSSVLLAGHARVLAALCGQRDVVIGYAARGAAVPMPCRLDTSCTTWRELLAESFCVESAMLIHRAFPVERLRESLGVTGPVFDTVFDPTSGHEAPWTVEPTRPPAHYGNPEPTPEPRLWVRVAEGAHGLVLRLTCRGELWDTAALTRVGGYHLRALESLAADLDSAHSSTHLLSSDELTYQIHGLAGPRHDLPDRRVHELIEAVAAAQPDAIAAVCGAQRWTYQELNRRANRIGRALLNRGLNPEEVVAVVCERNLDWMAAVLAIFKAGGVYLPIEPNFPAERIATILTRAGCRRVLTEPGSSSELDAALCALPPLEVLHTHDAHTEGRHDPATTAADGNLGDPATTAADDNLGVTVSADQLAYIYFTSGSTGEPKGAMCEHAGMLNHLQAKIADTGIGPGDVLAQTAPQGFDISLWQLLAAPLVGGTTLLVTPEQILDVSRFLDTIADTCVAVAQLVPSYLEAVVAHLERQPRALPHLKCVSTTGEALKKDLTTRWFAVQPGIPLLNAYGLTETSDDTNHEILHHPPRADRVPLGAPIPNVHIYLVDEHLQPVPLGAPGEIVYSGICVGRGYINDPERTRSAYLPDPHRPGQRLYRGGDIGRWLPGGKLEFLGRRDSQVKIRGFRIEIGEIENALLGAEEVRDGAVVVAGTGYDTHLVAFYTSAAAIPDHTLQTHLRRSLPSYMIPTAYHRRARLPLTANSKIDHNALTALAEQLDAGDGAPRPDSGGRTEQPPRTTAEHRVAAAWAAVLGVPQAQLDRQDHFFDRGGTSLTAVKLAIILNRAVSYRDVREHPTLAQLAHVLERAPQPAIEQSPAS